MRRHSTQTLLLLQFFLFTINWFIKDSIVKIQLNNNNTSFSIWNKCEKVQELSVCLLSIIIVRRVSSVRENKCCEILFSELDCQMQYKWQSYLVIMMNAHKNLIWWCTFMINMITHISIKLLVFFIDNEIQINDVILSSSSKFHACLVTKKSRCRFTSTVALLNYLLTSY